MIAKPVLFLHTQPGEVARGHHIVELVLGDAVAIQLEVHVRRDQSRHIARAPPGVVADNAQIADQDRLVGPRVLFDPLPDQPVRLDAARRHGVTQRAGNT